MTKKTKPSERRKNEKCRDYDCRRIMKINHSLLITIPARFARALTFEHGDYLEVILNSDSITIKELYTKEHKKLAAQLSEALKYQ